jgi:ketosteroid isomerase-like protein
VRAFMAQLQGLFADIRYTVDSVHVDEQRGSAVVEASSERTHVATGVRATLHYVFVYRFVDGLIAEMREYVNPLDLTNVPRSSSTEVSSPSPASL